MKLYTITFTKEGTQHKLTNLTHGQVTMHQIKRANEGITVTIIEQK